MTEFFFPIFAGTIATVRSFLYLRPIESLKVKGYKVHHYVYGAIGTAIGLFFNSLIIYTVGLGLFIDELAYFMMRGKDHDDYFHYFSVLGIFVFSSLVYIFKGFLISPFIPS